MKNNEQMISTDGLLYKIKRFFYNLFNKDKESIDSQTVENMQQEEKNAFEQSIIVVKDEEKERILGLQERFKQGKLNPEDVTEEDIDKISKLYDEQIAELNLKIDEDLKVIEACNKKINEYKRKQEQKIETA